ncbi:hypothetical protein J1614_004014 [Plenodomus biglobosus]|nr:hypothetical protein J1614_004014 [Plenodomus biglobosus]
MVIKNLHDQIRIELCCLLVEYFESLPVLLRCLSAFIEPTSNPQKTKPPRRPKQSHHLCIPTARHRQQRPERDFPVCAKLRRHHQTPLRAKNLPKMVGPHVDNFQKVIILAPQSMIYS